MTSPAPRYAMSTALIAVLVKRYPQVFRKIREARMTPEAESTIKPGDIVKLKSGGPEMTVSHQEHDGLVSFCIWMADGARCEGLFGRHMLVRVSDETEAVRHALATLDEARSQHREVLGYFAPEGITESECATVNRVGRRRIVLHLFEYIRDLHAQIAKLRGPCGKKIGTGNHCQLPSGHEGECPPWVQSFVVDTTRPTTVVDRMAGPVIVTVHPPQR